MRHDHALSEVNHSLAADTTDKPDKNHEFATGITDKDGYAARWGFSRRTIDNLLARGLPHLKIGARRVRIIIAEADQWMREQFGTQRLGPAH